MDQASFEHASDRQALFPGKSCFPLSDQGNKLAYRDSLDQLNVIFGPRCLVVGCRWLVVVVVCCLLLVGYLRRACLLTWWQA
jgi:hypothetical protein